MEQENKEVQITEAAMLFSKALNLLLSNNEGIVVDVPENLQLYQEMKKAVIVSSEGTTRVYNCEFDYPEGTPVSIKIEE